MSAKARGCAPENHSTCSRAGINKRIGWQTFRHTYSSTLIANGENVKVVQELMRHASSRFILEIYTQAKASAKRDAQQQIVEMMLPEEGLVSDIRLRRMNPPEVFGSVCPHSNILPVIANPKKLFTQLVVVRK